MRCVICESRADFVDGGFSFCDLHYRMWQHGYGKSIESMRAEVITKKVEPPHISPYDYQKVQLSTVIHAGSGI